MMIGLRSLGLPLIALVSGGWSATTETQDRETTQTIRIELDSAITNFHQAREIALLEFSEKADDAIQSATHRIRGIKQRLDRKTELITEVQVFRCAGKLPLHQRLRTSAKKCKKSIDTAWRHLAKAFDRAAERYESIHEDELALAVLRERKAFSETLQPKKGDQVRFWTEGSKVKGSRTEGDARLDGEIVESTPRGLVVEVTEHFGKRPRYQWIFERLTNDPCSGQSELELVGMRIMRNGQPKEQKHRSDFGGKVTLRGHHLKGQVVYSYLKKGKRTPPNSTDFQLRVLPEDSESR